MEAAVVSNLLDPAVLRDGAGWVVAILLILRFEKVLDKNLGRLAKQIELNTYVTAQVAGIDIEAAKSHIANGRE